MIVNQRNDVGFRGRCLRSNRLRGRGKSSGISVDSEVGCIFDFKQGKIARMLFCDRREALDALE